MSSRCFIAWLAVLGACSPSTPTGATARFVLSDGAPLAYGDVPFPSDLYLSADGQLALGALPTSNDGEPFFSALRELLAERDGFCTTCSLHAYVDGALDPASVPPSAIPSDVASVGDAIVLVQLDATPPRLLPLRVFYDDDDGHLAVRPVRGTTLAEGSRFALAITSQLRAADGTALRASDDFAAIRDGRSDHPSTTSAIDALEALGIARATLVSVTTFTTGSTVDEVRAVRRAVHAAPVPTFVVDRVIGAEMLDELFGVPSEDRPGLDVPPMAGTEGSRSVAHDAVGMVILGRIAAPRVISGSGDALGTLLTDDSGVPVAGPMQDVPFALAIPADVTSLESLPVLFAHHGFSESRADALFAANTAARAGYATFAIDAFLHGGRFSGAVDEVHDLRGSPGPDGMMEGDAGITRLFAIEGAPEGMALSPSYLIGTFAQMAADAMSAIRFLRDGDLSRLADAAPELTSLTFDRDHVAYLGVSMGTVVGASVLAAEPDIRAAVMFVPLGGIIEVLCDGAGFRLLAGSIFSDTLGVDGDFDEVTRSCVAEPIFDLMTWALEPIDPLALAPHFLDQPPAIDAPPDVLWVLASHDEAAAPPAAQSMLGVAGVAGVGPFMSVPLASATLPVTANHRTGATALAYLFSPAAHGLPEYSSGEARYAPPLEPPFVRQSATFENPVAEAHALFGSFLESALTGRARIE